MKERPAGMERRTKTTSGDRRRRVLRDDGSKTRSRSASAPKKTITLQLYESEAIASLQPRLTEFIPRRKRSLIACLSVGMLLVCAMQVLYLIRLDHLKELPAAATTPLHLMGAGTLSAWCSSILLAFASLVSLVIFSIRRHKVDDYYGRFGMWLTVGLACLLGSADASTGLHATFNATMSQLTGYQPFGWTGAWWAMIGGALGIYLIVRIVVDAWRSRGAVVALAFSVVTYAAATLFFFRVWRFETDQQDMMAHTSLLLTGHVLLAFSLLTYARYVYLEAAGEIGKKKRKKTKRKKTTAKKDSESGFFSRFRRAKGTDTKKRTKRTKPAPVVDDEVDSGLDDYDTDELDQMTDLDDERPLGKKARKRIKKQQRHAA